MAGDVKRVLVTGASTGLGLGAALALAGDGHEVIAHVRSGASDHATDSDWYAVVTGDLANAEEVRAVAEQVKPLGRLDAIVHNAGVPEVEGLLAVNVLAPYLLTALLEPPARSIFLSSGLHRSGSTDLSRLDRDRISYPDTKLYVTALAMELAERWPGTASHAVDPGWVPTRMGGEGAPDDLAAGHDTQVWLATADDVSPRTGGYWRHRRIDDMHPAAADQGFRSRLIGRLEVRTGVPLP